jgi:predicted protein tyrosine phosphatase
VYSEGVERVQIYLDVEELALLDREARTTGASRSELIRRSVRQTLGEQSITDRLHALDASAGAIPRLIAGADYVERLRGDLDERLRRQGLG